VFVPPLLVLTVTAVFVPPLLVLTVTAVFTFVVSAEFAPLPNSN